MATAAMGLSLQGVGAVDGMVDRFSFPPANQRRGTPGPVAAFDPAALALSLDCVRSFTSAVVDEVQRELRASAESQALVFQVESPTLRAGSRLVRLPESTLVTLRYASGGFLIEAPEFKLHGAGETVSEAFDEMSDHFEGLVEHYRNLRPDQLTPGGQRFKDKLLSLPGL